MQTYKFKTGPIQELSWGRFVINGQEHSKSSDGSVIGVGKDICFIGNQLRPWSERKGHLLTKDMVRCVADARVDMVIIGNGFYGALEVPEEVRQFLISAGKKVIIEETPKACARFNTLLKKGEKVALLAHGTC